MEEKIRIFNEKRKLVSAAVHALRETHRSQRSVDEAPVASSREIQRIIHNLTWIDRTLGGVQFDLDSREMAGDKADVYIEMADYTLAFLYQLNKDFKLFYDKSLISAPSVALAKLDTGLNVLVVIGKVLAFATLLLAAAPTLIVTTLPTLFSVVVNLITPLLFLLPVMTLATCGVGALLLGLKITHMAVEKYGQVKADSPQSHWQSATHKAAGKLLESDQATHKLNHAMVTAFFRSVPVLDNAQHHSSSHHAFLR